jgi:putative membrane protein
MKTFPPKALLLLATLVIAALVVSGLSPFDRVTWMLEVFPVLIALPLLAATRRRYPLTDLLYGLIALHALVLILGGAYSYARVPLGFWIADLLDLQRNPYDRIGHFFQGFVPAMIAREVFLRGDHVRSARMRIFLVLCTVLAISAMYELVEWAAALVLGQGADEFLGTQGDPWDTQSDMALALFGAVTALTTLSWLHDSRLGARPMADERDQIPGPSISA